VTLLTYLAIALLAMAIDGIACVIVQRKFNVLSSTVMALCWPVILPTVIIACAVITRNAPDKPILPQSNTLA
jgi:hypothetical protein